MIENPFDLWKQALFELELQMMKAPFDTWLRGTVSVVAEDNVLIVLVKNEYAVDWLGHRLIKPIKCTLRRLTENEDIAVRFVVSETWPPQVGDPSTALDPSTTLRMTSETLEPSAPSASDVRMTSEGGHGGHAEQVQDCHSERREESPESAVLEALYVALNRIDHPTARLEIQQEIDELEGKGNGHDVETWESPGELDKSRYWIKVGHYENQLWGTYLGAKEILCWMVILSEDKRPTKTPWTPYFRFSAPELARKVGCSTQLIHDLWRSCDADAPGAVLYAPQDTFGPVEQARKPGYYQYRPGLIERLRLAGVADYEIEGTRSRKLYVVSVKTNLGWLSPQQLSTLKPEVQRAHDRFVMQQGLDPALWH
jgi:hypothetical protein